MTLYDVAVPTQATLKKYGLSEADWRDILVSQGGICPICENEPKRFVIDHEHVRNWKNMLPEQRRLYVRGLVDWYCNHYFLRRGMTADKARNIADYLDEYETRRPE